MKIQAVGVVGAGVMGIGVAQNLAQTGHRVVLLDVSEDILQRAKSELMKQIRFQGLFNKGAKVEAPEEVLSRITFTTELEPFAEVEYVIENTTEKWEIKKEIYPQLDAICAPSCIFAANTSCIPITRFGSVTKRPANVIGIHFMNPVPMKPTVEVIRGYHTSEETIAATRELLAQMGKEGILVNDAPGFVSNRILMLTINEAVFTVQDQVASAEDVDQIFKKCFGHKMGPLETADLIGLDTILYSIEVLYDTYREDKYRPAPLLQKMVDAGLHGRKSGQGFFRYGKM